MLSSCDYLKAHTIRKRNRNLSLKLMLQEGTGQYPSMQKMIRMFLRLRFFQRTHFCLFAKNAENRHTFCSLLFTGCHSDTFVLHLKKTKCEHKGRFMKRLFAILSAIMLLGCESKTVKKDNYLRMAWWGGSERNGQTAKAA